MPFTPDQPSIPLATLGDCPHCQRPILSLAEDRCGFCGLGLGSTFADLPSVQHRLNEIAWGWTPAHLEEWLGSRPLDLAWAQASGVWRNLAWFVDGGLWLGWANGLASLRGRGKDRWAEGTQVFEVQLAGLGAESAWVRLRVRGRRWSLPWVMGEGWDEEGQAELQPFTEIWILSATGQPDSPPHCVACGSALRVQELHCSRCGSPTRFSPGPWLLRALHAEPGPRAGGAPSPFEGGAHWES